MAKDPILTLDIGAHSLKIAEFVEARGGLEMTRYAVTDLGLDPQSDADISQYLIQAIHGLLAESGCKPGPVQLSISGHSVFSKFVKLPPTTPDKVLQVIQYEAQQNIPFPLNEVVWDYQIVTGKDGDAEVMLAAIKAADIEKVCSAVEFAGLKPDLVDIAPMALYNAVRYNYDNLPDCTLLVDIGARSTDLVFIEAGRVFSRNVPVAGNQISQNIQQEFENSFDEAEDLKKRHAYVGLGGPFDVSQSETTDRISKTVRAMMTRLHQEINRSINFYRSQQNGLPPSLILLTGGSSSIPNADVFLREKLKVDVDYFNPFNNVAVAEQIPADQIGAHACELGVVVGLALRKCHTCPVSLDLLPPQYEEEKKFKRKVPYFLASAAVLLLTIGLWIVGYGFLASGSEETRQKVDARVRELAAQEGDLAEAEAAVDRLRAQVERLADIEANRGTWREIVAEVSSKLPEGVWLTKVAPLTSATAVAKPSDDEGAGRRRRRHAEEEDAAPAQVADPSRPCSMRGLDIEGMGYTDISQDAEGVIRAFRDDLRNSPLFRDDETDIVYQKPPMPGDPTFEFKLSVILDHRGPQAGEGESMEEP